METHSPSLREKLRQLRRRFLDKLPRILAETERLCDGLTRTPCDERLLADLLRTFHSLKGTGASFGLVDISAEGAAGEHLVRQIQSMECDQRGGLVALLVPDFRARTARLLDLGRAARDLAEDGAAPAVETVDDGSWRRSADLRRVFICDDEELLAEQLAAQLSCFGYLVTIYTDPQALSAAVIATPPDVIVMDIIFPDGDDSGTDSILALQRDLRNPPPVVFVSARRDFGARLRAVQAGGAAYFPKPLRAVDVVETLDRLTQRQEPEPYRVLVVDDEEEVAAYHGFILEQVGMSTRMLQDSTRILDVLADFKPDLVLMDMYMPACSGRELSRLIRQVPEYVSLPIVFLSSETDKVKQVSALRVGAEGFLTKPIQPEDLISAVAIRAERMRTLRSLMVRDSLTGLFNHTFMSQFLDSAMAAIARDGGNLVFVMLDVDHFKKVNDSYGHPAGDQVLVALARILQQRLRHSDMVARYGGEEFAAVLQNVSLAAAATIINGLREDFMRVRFQAGDREFNCTFSGGVAAFPDCATAETLLETADQALYRAKNTGRNRIIAGRCQAGHPSPS